MRILKEDICGLVIDIQERLFPVMHKKEELLKHVQILVNGLNELSVPLTITQQYTKGLGETIEEVRSCFNEFSYFEKRDFSCCDDQEIFSHIKKQGFKNIVICGIEAHVCVLQTAIDIKDAGLNPIVVVDCISSRTPENIELAKERFRHENIMMASYESILFELTRSAAAIGFKAISKLVK